MATVFPVRQRPVMWLSTLLLSLWTLPGLCAEAVDFILPDLDGQQRRLSEFRGKWVLVNYWATWCPPCLEELSELELFHEAHHDWDAVVLGVNFERIDRQRLREFVEEQFLSFPVLHRPPGRESELGRIPGLPTSFLVAPDGAVMARHVGPVTAEQVERYIERFNAAQGAQRVNQ